DRAALARGVAPLEQDDELLSGLLDPDLELEQLDLEAVLVALVAATRHAMQVRIAARAPIGAKLAVLGFADRLHARALLVEQALQERGGVVGREVGEDVAHRGRLVDRDRLDAL